ncbi:MFS transporter [Actinomadura darangshiensis]|nr:MFS transporter [Actinomadura darangshiensis]
MGSRPRHLRLFIGGQALSLVGDGSALVAIPLLVLELSRNPLVSGLSAASVTLGHLFVGLPSGVLVDRLDPYRVLIAMDAARALVFTVLFALWATGLLNIWLILSLGVVNGACQVFFETALVVVVKDLFPDDALLRANSTIELAKRLSFALGPAAVGALAVVGGIGVALLVNALTFTVSLASLAAVRRRTVSRAVPGLPSRWRQLTADFLEGLRYLFSVRTLVILTAVQMMVNLCLAAEKLVFYYGRDTLGLSASAVSIVMVAGGVGGVFGALSVSWLVRRIGRTRLIVVAIAACGTAVAAMSAAGSLPALILVNAAYLWTLVVASLVNRTRRQQIVPRPLLGRVTGTVRLLFLAVDPLGVIITGTLTTALGGDPRLVFLGAGTLVVATAVAGWYAGLRDDDRSLTRR